MRSEAGGMAANPTQKMVDQRKKIAVAHIGVWSGSQQVKSCGKGEIQRTGSI